MQSSLLAGNDSFDKLFKLSNQPDSNFNAFLTSSNKLYNNFLKFTMLDLDKNSTCFNNCSGHGECFNNVCFCEVEFSGKSCNSPNLSYYIAFSTIFFVLCLISFVQLVSFFY